MFNLGPSEIVMIAAMALVFFGPDKLPELARLLARAIGELRRVSTELNHTFQDAVQTVETETGAPLPDLRKLVSSLDPREILTESPARSAFGAPAPGSSFGVATDGSAPAVAALPSGYTPGSVPLDQAPSLAPPPAAAVVEAQQPEPGAGEAADDAEPRSAEVKGGGAGSPGDPEPEVASSPSRPVPPSEA